MDMTTDNDLLRNVEAVRDAVERLYALIGESAYNYGDLLFLKDEGRELDPADHFAEEDLENLELDTEAIWQTDDFREVAHELLNEYPLSIEGVWKGSSKEGADLSTVIVTYCTGGPHVELDTTRRQWIGYWGGETVYRMADSDLCSYYDEMVEGLS